MPKRTDHPSHGGKPGKGKNGGGSGGDGLTAAQRRVLANVADGEMEKEARAANKQLVKKVAKEVRRADQQKKKKKKAATSSDSDSDADGSSSSALSESEEDYSPRKREKKKKKKHKSDKPDDDKPMKPAKQSKVSKLYDEIERLKNENVKLQLNAKGFECELTILKSQLAAHTTHSGSSSRSGTTTITFTSKQFEDILAGAKVEGDKVRTPEAPPLSSMLKKDIFGSVLTFAKPSAEQEGKEETVPDETKTVIANLRAKVKEAAANRSLSIGSSKVGAEQHRLAQQLAKECSRLHFTTKASYKLLKEMVDTEGVQSTAQYSETLLIAIFKCCISRDAYFLDRSEIGLPE